MKTLLLISLVLACRACFGQAAEYRSQLPAPATVAGAVFWWQGARYELKDVAANDEMTITFDTNLGKLQVPWDQVPVKIQRECSDDRETALKARNDAEIAAEDARIQATGAIWLTGNVAQVLEGGVLMDRGDGQNYMIKGVGGLADGDHLSVWAKPDGTFSYTTVLGATATVRAYDYVSSHR